MNETNGVEADQSASLGELAAALAKAQGAMHHASKDKTNPHFKSKYADLASVLDACREPLAANGLAVIQTPGNCEGGVLLTTTLLHASGQWIRTRFSMPVGQQTAHAYGSILSYLRRYSLASMVGIGADDDDANSAVVVQTPRPTQAPASSPPPAARSAEVKAAAQRKMQIQEEPPPPTDADAPPHNPQTGEVFEAMAPRSDLVDEPVDDSIVIPKKNKRLSEATVNDLTYWADRWASEAGDPKSGAWNQRRASAARAELARRQRA